MDHSDHLKSKMEYVTNVNHANKFLVGQNIKTVLFLEEVKHLHYFNRCYKKINDDKRATTPKKKNVSDHEKR